MRLYQPNFQDLPQKLFFSITCIDRDPYFSYLVKIPLESLTTNMATYVVPRHPVTIWSQTLVETVKEVTTSTKIKSLAHR